MNTMYAKLPNLVIGFHGCSKKTYEYDALKDGGEGKYSDISEYRKAQKVKPDEEFSESACDKGVSP